MSMFSPPSTPDPQTGINLGNQVASQQQNYNTAAGINSQVGSMVNQNNPYGSLSYQQTGVGPNGTPIYSSNVSLTPEQQQLFNTLQSTQQQAGTAGNQLLTNANYGASNPTTAIGDMSSGLTSQQMAAYQQSMQPFFTTDRNQLDTKLKNQGLYPGTPAYDNAMRSLDTSQTNAVAGAAAQFEPQAFQQATSLYQMPASMATALSQFGAPGNATSQLVNAPALNEQPANLISATGTEQNALNQQYAAQMQQYSAMMSGLFGAGSAAAGGWAKAGFPGLSGLGGAGDAAAAVAF